MPWKPGANSDGAAGSTIADIDASDDFRPVHGAYAVWVVFPPRMTGQGAATSLWAAPSGPERLPRRNAEPQEAWIGTLARPSIRTGLATDASRFLASQGETWPRL